MKGFTEPKPARLLSGESLRKTPFDSWTTLWSRKMNFKKEKLSRYSYIEPDFLAALFPSFSPILAIAKKGLENKILLSY